MAITTTINPPLVTDTPTEFDSKAFAAWQALNTWASQANALAVDASNSESAAAASASSASSSASSAATSANTATTKAAEALGSASNASTSASTATTQAGIATTKATEAAASAADAAATVASKVSKTGDTINGDLTIAEAVPTGDNPRTVLNFEKLQKLGGSPFSTSLYTVDFGDKPSASKRYGQVDFKPFFNAQNGAAFAGGITADTSAINIGGGQIVKDTSGKVTFGAGPIGYGTGAGGTVTQATSKSTPVTITPARPNWLITTNNATLAAGATVQFVVNNSLIEVNDMLLVSVSDGVSDGTAYNVWVGSMRSGFAYISLRNITGSGLGESVQIRCVLIKGSNA